MDVKLIPASDAAYAWMLGRRCAPSALRLPPGGVEAAPVVAMLREQRRKLIRRGCRASWLIVSGDMVVGLCCFLDVPDACGTVAIGYGIAASRRRLGLGSAALALLVRDVARDFPVRYLTAETGAANVASQRMLARNGFVRVGRRRDREDGPLIRWRRALPRFCHRNAKV